ncbi:unnamed protein product [Brachionus calyciflorus]|uniref:Uncharacterized protein n=1 Tax=Brachionus calyciflorus TaxID=104777 RepID=A0A814Q7J0_9BILA|nr:unnamed protein product [Brachionus calyciflorus]
MDEDIKEIESFKIESSVDSDNYKEKCKKLDKNLSELDEKNELFEKLIQLSNGKMIYELRTIEPDLNLQFFFGYLNIYDENESEYNYNEIHDTVWETTNLFD